MSCTSPSAPRARLLVVLAAAAAAGLLAGCEAQPPHLSNDFGVAVRQDLKAQIADPDPASMRKPATADGVRSALAVTRYETDTVKSPSGSASDVGAKADSAAK